MNPKSIALPVPPTGLLMGVPPLYNWYITQLFIVPERPT
jgi:hypothetical protein